GSSGAPVTVTCFASSVGAVATADGRMRVATSLGTITAFVVLLRAEAGAESSSQTYRRSGRSGAASHPESVYAGTATHRAERTSEGRSTRCVSGARSCRTATSGDERQAPQPSKRSAQRAARTARANISACHSSRRRLLLPTASPLPRGGRHSTGRCGFWRAFDHGGLQGLDLA